MANSEKLLGILKLITSVDRLQGATQVVLSEECGVCARTIYRYINDLV